MKRGAPASRVETPWPGKRVRARTPASPRTPPTSPATSPAVFLGEAPPQWPGQHSRAERLQPAPARAAARPTKAPPTTPSSSRT